MEIPILLVLSPVIAYLVAGSTKFAINSLRTGSLAFGRIGLGGFPSTHNTITSTCCWVVGASVGFSSIPFLICLAYAIIVTIDSLDLRQKISSHAAALNQMNKSSPNLRESLGHTPFEVLGGICLGALLGFCLHTFA